jgi:parallel beta-helix repeat protein
MKTLLLAGTLLFFWADSSLSAAAPEVTCGATLSGKKFTLSADLDCRTSAAPITLTNKAQLDLNGHTIFGFVVQDGEGTLVRNGRIDCVFLPDVCLTIQGKGGHTLENVLVQHGIYTTVSMTANNNRLLGNTANGSELYGFSIEGDNNIIQGNIAVGSQYGFVISGHANQLIGNSGTGNVDDFRLFGDSNFVRQNTASSISRLPEAVGFGIYGHNNRIVRNVVANSSLNFLGVAIEAAGQNNLLSENLAPDQTVKDFNINCGSNTWTENVFGTSNQTCIK